MKSSEEVLSNAEATAMDLDKPFKQKVPEFLYVPQCINGVNDLPVDILEHNKRGTDAVVMKHLNE